MQTKSASYNNAWDWEPFFKHNFKKSANPSALPSGINAPTESKPKNLPAPLWNTPWS